MARYLLSPKRLASSLAGNCGKGATSAVTGEKEDPLAEAGRVGLDLKAIRSRSVRARFSEGLLAELLVLWTVF